MPLLNLDHQPEAIRQLFESLVESPEGSVAELNGKPLARILPADTRDPAWSDAKTSRRSDLIDRDIAGTITADEALELELLQEELQRHVERTAPLPLDHVRMLHPRFGTKKAKLAMS